MRLAEYSDIEPKLWGRMASQCLRLFPVGDVLHLLWGGQSCPQPRKDAERERGMAAFVGRLRPCHVFDYKFVVLSHNTIRGAAGAAVLNAELMHSEGMLD